MRTFWLYSLARLGIIAGVGIILFPLLGLNLLMAAAAIIIGALLSYLLLGSMRARVASDIEARFAARGSKRKRKSADDAAEDLNFERRFTEDESPTAEEHTADVKPTADEGPISKVDGGEK